ncbi:mercury resistance system substrate-binding protein MerP [Fictibacillus sp. 5RED26]|uniref:mercury resistance system substrate-binding protein MerP n=1 Tax=Fictibacillus sp. 5RED26 TaxID=2745876 RepID=UPI0018CD30BC|nr:mercury resistance system substrate-binding protein MerP [Fictibacillus sp. 5RED26]MBH0158584.1 mercury resistance system substrate-binding protein MerP [Fictibacillus sp. 5RED26]
MRVQIIRNMMVLSLLLVVSACSNEQEIQKTEVSKSEVKTTAMNSEKDVKAITEAETKGTFMVMAGMDCCPPSVVEDAVAQVEGAGKTAVKVNGRTAKVTVSFDDTKTNLDAIKTAVSDLGLPVE